jgi:hypothetical protein
MHQLLPDPLQVGYSVTEIKLILGFQSIYKPEEASDEKNFSLIWLGCVMQFVRAASQRN